MSENMTIAEARAAERERIKAILCDPVAQDRRQAAEALAFGSSMDAAEAVSLLATLEVGAPKAAVPGMRSADAPGGLIAFDPETGEQVPGIVSSDPTPLRNPDPIKAMWKETIAGINRETGGATAAK
ncbi:hypothetical protein ACFO1V_09935 [Daeguia caeni]|uniref:Uncharacterized protein n=1 Tax=Daeguia caeni TaxID=439612 RepID=A0ABV9H8Z5_9HYPH